MMNAKKVLWLAGIAGLIGVLAFIGNGMLAHRETAIAAIVNPIQSQPVRQLAPDIFAYHNLEAVAIMCTLATTTTTTLPNITTIENAAMIANYTGLALAVGGKGAQIEPQKNFFRLDNAIVGWEYRVQAIPDGVGNYNLAMIVYDRDRNIILTDANPFDGNSASIVLSPANTGPYYFEISQYSEQCSGGTYRLVVSSVQPTNTATPTNTPTAPTITTTPAPTWIPGFDQYEPNFDFDTATTVAPGVTYNLNFVPWGGLGPDNDYFRLWIKPGLFFACETLELNPGVDTNMILYDANRNLISGNDDRALGDYSSRLSYYASYEGWLYMLVGHGGRMDLRDTADSDYKLRCTMTVPGTPAAGQPTSQPVDKDITPAPTRTPQPPSSPVATPTSAPATENVTLSFRSLTIPTPLVPTPTPSGFRTFRVIIFYDTNNDGLFGAGEGVPGFFIRVLHAVSNEELARSYTDDQGQQSFTVPTPGAVRLLIPLLGLDRLVDPNTPEVKVRIVPSTLPATIP